MSPTQVAILGAIAGSTIFLGLPIGRLRAPMPRLKTGLNAVATGILVFLLWDVLTHAWAPVDEALSHHEIGDAAAKGVVLAATVGVGLLGLVWVDRFVSRQRGARLGGPGAATVSDVAAPLWGNGGGGAGLWCGGGNRPAQFRRGVGDRHLSRRGPDQPGCPAVHWVRAAQRHRGLWHRRAAGRSA